MLPSYSYAFIIVVIVAVVYYLLSAIWKSHHQHTDINIVIGIGIGIQIARFLFCLQNFFFEKAEHLCSFLRLVIVSVPHSHKYLFPIHPLNNVHWSSRKKLFELLETSVHWCFGKITVRNIYAYFPGKHTGWSPYSVHSQALLGLSQKSALKQLLCRESASAWFSKKKCHSRRNLKNCPEFYFFVICFWFIFRWKL